MQRIRGRWLAALVVAVATSACSAATTPAPTAAGPTIAPGATTAAIDAADLDLRVGILAADSMRGRETGTPGAAAATRYLTNELERLGLRPAGDDGSYLQAVPLERHLSRATFSVTAPDGSRTLSADEILPVSGLGGLPRAIRSSGSGELIFGGFLIDPEIGADELNFSELRDAVVVLRLGAAPGVDPTGATPRASLAALFGANSPASAIVLIAEASEAAFWDYAAEIAGKGSLTLEGANDTEPVGPPFFLATPETAESLIGVPLSEARAPRQDLGTAQFTLDNSVEPVEAWNVAAIVPGADPARARQYVGLGAHYDHVGVGAPVNGDSIYNGADDNASGTSGLLEVAEALAHLPQDKRPARSVLIVWNTAEESGLLGSDYFTANPTVPRDSIVVHINVDMIGRNSPDSIFSVGSRRLSTELGTLVEEVNQRQPQPFVFDYSYDVPGHPEQIYCRSDHYSYAKYGIPIVFLTTGLHEDYHAPSDEAAEINDQKLARVSDLLRDITLELANRSIRPTVDQPVPPLGAPCV